jgi:uncharacterized membrane protein YqaE (UPF0057 family)
MRFLFCWLFPPLAVLSCGRPISAVFNFFLTCFFWYPGVIHAQATVERYYNDQRNKKMLQAVNYPAWAQHVFAAQPNQRLELPAPKKRRSKQKAVDIKEPVYNDPTVGENGTRFRKRG